MKESAKYLVMVLVLQKILFKINPNSDVQFIKTPDIRLKISLTHDYRKQHERDHFIKHYFKKYFKNIIKKVFIFCQPIKSNVSCGQKMNSLTIYKMFCSKKLTNFILFMFIIERNNKIYIWNEFHCCSCQYKHFPISGRSLVE